MFNKLKTIFGLPRESTQASLEPRAREIPSEGRFLAAEQVAALGGITISNEVQFAFGDQPTIQASDNGELLEVFDELDEEDRLRREMFDRHLQRAMEREALESQDNDSE